MAETESASATTTDGWKHTGVRVVPSDQLDSNTAQTPGMPIVIHHHDLSDNNDIGMTRAAAINFARVGAQKLWAGTVTSPSSPSPPLLSLPPFQIKH